MLKVTVLLALVLLGGCHPPNNLNKAQQDYVCIERGGVYKYGLVLGNNPTTTRCRNGDIIKVLYDQQIPPEFYPNND